MKVLKFRTSIDSQEALSQVAPYLGEEPSINKWSIDTSSEENILSVSGQDINPQTVESAVEKAGFKAEVIRVIGIDGGDL